MQLCFAANGLLIWLQRIGPPTRWAEPGRETIKDLRRVVHEQISLGGVLRLIPVESALDQLCLFIDADRWSPDDANAAVTEFRACAREIRDELLDATALAERMFAQLASIANRERASVPGADFDPEVSWGWGQQVIVTDVVSGFTQLQDRYSGLLPRVVEIQH